MIRIVLACLALAGAALLGLSASGSFAHAPGAGAVREMRESVALQRRAFDRLARGGELERAMGSRQSGRACHWHRGQGGWMKTCR